MSDFFEQPPDPIDALLAPNPVPARAAFRQAVLAHTTATLRQRRRRQRLARLVALAACYAAGLVTMHDIPHPVPSHSQPAALSVARTEEPVSAVALEWQAIDHPARASTLFRAAGDRYLADDADLQAAARCYGNALSEGSAADLAIQPTDSWLLIAIKDARQKERRDADGID